MKPVLCFIIIFVSVNQLVFAESTFFDDSNDAFIMGQASAISAADISSRQGDGGGGSSCSAGYNFTDGKCINMTRISGINTGGEANKSPSRISPIPSSEQEEGAPTTEEPQAIKEQQLIVNTPNNVSAEADKGWLLYITLALGIILFVIVCVLLIWKRKKRPPVTVKYPKILTK